MRTGSRLLWEEAGIRTDSWPGGGTAGPDRYGKPAAVFRQAVAGRMSEDGIPVRNGWRKKMNVKEFSEKIGGRILTGAGNSERQISGIYCCDLLSWVMSHAARGSAWITVHNHVNIVAVAALTEISCIIIPEGIEAEESTLKKADAEGIIIISTDMSAYEICCAAHDCGI